MDDKNNVTEPTVNIDAASIQKKIASGQFNQALAELQLVFDQDASNPMLIIWRQCVTAIKMNYAKAQQHLDALKDLALDKGRVYQEQGHLYRAQGLTQRALVAYQTACQLNPALIAGWKAQAELFTSEGNVAAAKQAHMQLLATAKPA